MNQNIVGIGAYARPVGNGGCGCSANGVGMSATEAEAEFNRTMTYIGVTFGVICLVVFPLTAYVLWKEAQG
jgi:hypothetical protein